MNNDEYPERKKKESRMSNDEYPEGKKKTE